MALPWVDRMQNASVEVRRTRRLFRQTSKAVEDATAALKTAQTAQAQALEAFENAKRAADRLLLEDE